MARRYWPLVSLVLLVGMWGILVAVGALPRWGTGTIDGYRPGEAIACAPGREVEPGAVVTCEQLVECAQSALWETEQPAVVAATVHQVPPREPGALGGAGGWIVVFDLVGGDQRAAQISLVPQCLDRFRTPAAP